MQRKVCNESNVISNFFGAVNIYKKYNVNYKDFVEILGLLVIKIHLPIQFDENIWLKHLAM
jgi:hypothetical protein